MLSTLYSFSMAFIYSSSSGSVLRAISRLKPLSAASGFTSSIIPSLLPIALSSDQIIW